MSKATIGCSAWFVDGSDPTQYTLSARLNGKAWRSHTLTADEAALRTKVVVHDPNGLPLGACARAPSAGPVCDGNQGASAILIDVHPSDLVDGDNTVEFQTTNVPTNYPPAVVNVDLVLSTQ